MQHIPVTSSQTLSSDPEPSHWPPPQTYQHLIWACSKLWFSVCLQGTSAMNYWQRGDKRRFFNSHHLWRDNRVEKGKSNGTRAERPNQITIHIIQSARGYIQFITRERQFHGACLSRQSCTSQESQRLDLLYRILTRVNDPCCSARSRKVSSL